MKAHLQIISHEIIKPSSKTPQQSQNLSSFDQLSPHNYIPLIFFYKENESKNLTTSNHLQISENLKKSLSETLTSFYPLAGRVKVLNNSVDCNDAGAVFIDAQIHSNIIDFVREPNDVAQLKKLLPLDPVTAGGPDDEGPLLFVQINFFGCGGIAVGICMAHQVGDGVSMMSFLKAWAATTRGEPEIISRPNFDLATFFPAKNYSGSKIWKPNSSNKNITTKRFVFNKNKLGVLKQAAVASTVKDPTRVELVSSFIWKHFSQFNKDKFCVAAHAVNLRTRIGPTHQILKNVFGNFTTAAAVLPNGIEDEREIHDLVGEFRSSLRDINGDYLAKVGTEYCPVEEMYNFHVMNERLFEPCFFTSWCRFGVYEVDFGWGKPVWICSVGCSLENVVFLVDDENEEGIEAWVTMNNDIVEILENQLEKLIR